MNVLFVHNALQSFVRVDRDLLASHFNVEEIVLSRASRLTSLPAAVTRADMLFAWFASAHSLVPVMACAALRKPSIVVVGGYDTANRPDIGYGSMTNPVKARVVRTICGAASALLVNSCAAAAEVRGTTRTETPIHVVYHGFPPHRDPLILDREPIVISVGAVSRESLKRKGHELFVRTASLLPEVRFILAGRCVDDAATYLRSIASPNVTITGFLTEEGLQALYNTASVYVQASQHEGFGCSVAEAMIAGCVPVVHRTGALPEVVDGEGIIVNSLQESAFRDAILTALASPPSARERASRRVERHFSLEARRDKLIDLVRDVTSSPLVTLRPSA